MSLALTLLQDKVDILQRDLSAERRAHASTKQMLDVEKKLNADLHCQMMRMRDPNQTHTPLDLHVDTEVLHKKKEE